MLTTEQHRQSASLHQHRMQHCRWRNRSWVAVRRLPVSHFLLFGKPNSAVSLQIPPNFLRSPETAKRFETAEKVVFGSSMTQHVVQLTTRETNIWGNAGPRRDLFSGLDL